MSPRRPESNETQLSRLRFAGSLACWCSRHVGVHPWRRIAIAEPVTPEGIAGLVAAVANADQKLQDLGADIQAEQEGVNKAIVGVQTARDNAAAAKTRSTRARSPLADATAAISSAQGRFDTFAASAYMNGPSASYVTAKDPADILQTAAVGETLNVSTQQAISDLQRARTEQVNRESAARLAKQKADQAVVDAQSSQDAAVAALTQAQQTFKDQQAQLDQLTAERVGGAGEARRRRGSGRRPSVTRGRQPRRPRRAAAGAARRDATGTATPPRAAPGSAKWDTGWDPTLPAIPSAFVSGDPIAIINAHPRDRARPPRRPPSRWAAASCRSSASCPTPSGLHQRTPFRGCTGRQASEYVIRRAMSQLGVPVLMGRRERQRAVQRHRPGRGNGGLRLLGALSVRLRRRRHQARPLLGIAVRRRPQDPVIQMRRGDLIFYGPNASQHVAMYLGNGQMLRRPIPDRQ